MKLEFFKSCGHINKQNRFLLFSLILVITISCKEESIFKPHDNLIDFRSHHVYNMRDIEKLPESEVNVLFSEEFNPKTDTIRFEDDLIHISCLSRIGCWPTYAGDIKISNDTIRLIVKNTSGMSCTEFSATRLYYTIRNPLRVNYVVKKF